jgi:uncharacterized protein with PQ loop repeat
MQWLVKNPFKKPAKGKENAILMFDRVMYAIAFIGPILSVPQVIKIVMEKSAASVSGLTWVSFAFLSVFWLVYAILHKKTPLIISSAGSLFVQVLVVLGTIVY